MEENKRITAIKDRLTALENVIKEETTVGKGRAKSAKVMMVLKWHKNLANKGRTVETDAGTQDIMLDAAIRLVKSLEEVDEKWKN